jgi:hypothetical protein
VTTYSPGDSATLIAEWRMYAGGPLVAVTGVSITITPSGGGAPLLGPTSVGVTAPAVGLNVYAWQVPDTTGPLIATWSGVDSDGDVVTAVEVIEIATSAQLYVPLSTVKLALGKGSEDDRDDLIVSAIGAASRLIDGKCGRRFYRDAVPTTRTYRTAGRLSGGGQLLLIDDLATDDGLVIESGPVWTTVPGAVSGTWPANAYATGRPATALYATSTWSTYEQVRITGRWGWPAVPDQIGQAALLMAVRLFRRKDSPHGVAGGGEWGPINVSRVDPDVEALIRPFVIPGFA